MWAGVVMGGRCADESYWVHPSAADAAIHAGAALRGPQEVGMMVSVSVGYYGVQTALTGKHPQDGVPLVFAACLSSCWVHAVCLCIMISLCCKFKVQLTESAPRCLIRDTGTSLCREPGPQCQLDDLCCPGHEAHVGVLLSRQQADGSVLSGHRLSSSDGSLVLSMGEVHARPLRAMPAAAVQHAAVQQRTPAALHPSLQACLMSFA